MTAVGAPRGKLSAENLTHERPEAASSQGAGPAPRVGSHTHEREEAPVEGGQVSGTPSAPMGTMNVVKNDPEKWPFFRMQNPQ